MNRLNRFDPTRHNFHAADMDRIIDEAFARTETRGTVRGCCR